MIKPDSGQERKAACSLLDRHELHQITNDSGEYWSSKLKEKSELMSEESLNADGISVKIM